MWIYSKQLRLRVSGEVRDIIADKEETKDKNPLPITQGSVCGLFVVRLMKLSARDGEFITGSGFVTHTLPQYLWPANTKT